MDPPVKPERFTSQRSSDPDRYDFGRWSFSVDTGDLNDGETSTRLEPQVGKLLGYFLNNQNKLVSRDELIASDWGNRIVSDDAINRCVSILRQTLSPDDKNAYIETVSSRGLSLTGKPTLSKKGPHSCHTAKSLKLQGFANAACNCFNASICSGANATGSQRGSVFCIALIMVGVNEMGSQPLPCSQIISRPGFAFT
jgi:DNA-binding winged helix-turn-helix (wHTH) protein